MNVEPTVLSRELLLFYASCGIVGIGATMAAAVLIVFPESESKWTLAIIGIVMVVVGSVACLRYLKAARNE